MEYTTHHQNNYNKHLKGREVCRTFNTSTCVVSEQRESTFILAFAIVSLA